MKLPGLLSITMFFLFAACSSVQNTGRSGTQEEAVKKLLDSRRYRFVAQTMQTQSGWTVQANNQWLDLRNDTLMSSLPYFGVSRSPELGGTTGPLNFTSTDFNYSGETRRTGNSRITLSLNDSYLDAQEFYLDVSTSGYATLRVRFNSRQPVSFYGEVQALPVKKIR